MPTPPTTPDSADVFIYTYTTTPDGDTLHMRHTMTWQRTTIDGHTIVTRRRDDMTSID